HIRVTIHTTINNHYTTTLLIKRKHFACRSERHASNFAWKCATFTGWNYPIPRWIHWKKAHLVIFGSYY
ncbi:MAG: hypothetical protein LBJ89_02440, partial [Holosporales bacterium]|nr:hypothetical protein [Holosporales bacterium]